MPAVLRVRDKDGNVIDIPSIKGADGKSAYQSAVDGGYKGTEEEFNSTYEYLKDIKQQKLL